MPVLNISADASKLAPGPRTLGRFMLLDARLDDDPTSLDLLAYGTYGLYNAVSHEDVCLLRNAAIDMYWRKKKLQAH